MDTSKLKKFAQFARRALITQVGAKLESVVAESSAARREHPDAMRKLEAAIAKDGKDQVIERVAYTWFNRFSALRFMDVNELTPVRVVSPVTGQFQPEILAEAKAGHIDESRVHGSVREQVRGLLDGRTPSSDAQTEAYRLLLVAVCNDFYRAMPFLFEQIDNYTELLLPDDLLSNASILAYVREAMTPDVCEDVEVIGWLYQFYISEKKDEVFAGLKKNKKITADNIPAATQLFTPHWIVRYLVENSLGRLWLLNRPHSQLAVKMDYYIASEEPEAEFLLVLRPEDIRICDPACGSGHMLTYAFDLLYEIYEEEGYEATEIPGLILTHNLYGIEIDDRAGALAAFALAMKAAIKLGRRRFLRQAPQPNICVLQDVRFTPSEMQDVAAVVNSDLFTADFRETMGQFNEAKNFGSLTVPKLRDPGELVPLVRFNDVGDDLLLREVRERVLKVLEMAEALSPKYHVVVANPPYAGSKGLTSQLSDWLAKNYPDSKSDLMTAFMERSSKLTRPLGVWGMINLPSWMFLTSFNECRSWLLHCQTVISLLHLGRGIFGSDFGSTAFIIKNGKPSSNSVGTYIRLFDRHVEVRKPEEIESRFLSRKDEGYAFQQTLFSKIPNMPMAYWVKESFVKAFGGQYVHSLFEGEGKNITSNNESYLRMTWEVGRENSGVGKKWLPYAKGGEFRRWGGNIEHVVNWSQQARDFYRKHPSGRIIPEAFWYREGVTWSPISALGSSFRFLPAGTTFDTKGLAVFPRKPGDELEILAVLNARTAQYILDMVNPTISVNLIDVKAIPFPIGFKGHPKPDDIDKAIVIASNDWNASETSWDFTALPLLSSDYRERTLEGTYTRLRAHWQGMTDELLRLEEENNKIFIDAYGLQDELSPEVPVEQITLTCNPAYSLKGDKTVEQREADLLARTMEEFLHYAVGCLFGRYSLDAPGLILADQGKDLADYLARVPKPSFDVDADNVIPVLDGDWFADDISERIRKFLRVTFGEAHFQENLTFIESALGKKIGKWFIKDFFDYHVRRYKKRPIYWMFASPKGSFQALIYVHRYQPDTVSIVLNDYLREYRNKLEAHRKAQEAQSINPEATPAQRTKALKEVVDATKVIEELDGYERGVLYPLATRKIKIDLDAGVKFNYLEFGAALKPIKGLSEAVD